MKVTVHYSKNNSTYNNRVSGKYHVLICLLDKLRDGEYEENGNRVGCKDYIGDSIAYQRLGFPNGGSSPTKPISTDNFCFSFLTYDKEATSLLIKQSKILNSLEKKVGIPETKFYISADNYVVIDADKFWVQSTLTTSTIIQIVRSLIYPTNKRRVLTHFKECLKLYTNQKDTSYWTFIIESGVDLEFLLTNIETIINGNPFTSCNDEYIKSLVGKTKNRDGKWFEYDYESIDTKDINGRDLPVQYYRGLNHGSHGIVNFCNNISRLKDNNNDIKKLTTGYYSKHFKNFETWAFNYQLLKEGL